MQRRRHGSLLQGLSGEARGRRLSKLGAKQPESTSESQANLILSVAQLVGESGWECYSWSSVNFMLPYINYNGGELSICSLTATDLAERFGTPLYVYSADAIVERFGQVTRAFEGVSPLICYALKASGNLHLLRLLSDEGAGMDVVSGGELERAWLSGTPMSKVVFAGVGKSDREIASALSGEESLLGADFQGRDGLPARERGPVGLFNIESPQEAERIARIAARLNVRASACLRVNPDVDAKTHKYTTTGKKENKFGVDLLQAKEILSRWRGHSHLAMKGIHLHLGSPIASPAPYVEAVGVISSMLLEISPPRGEQVMLNIGGGYGIDYGVGEEPASIEAFAAALMPQLTELHRQGVGIVLEPGRCIVAHAGVLLTRVEYVKQGREKQFVICDAGMHTLLRPALYEAFHAVWPARVDRELEPRNLRELAAWSTGGLGVLAQSDVVGPICESSDFLAMNRGLPSVLGDQTVGGVRAGDLMAVFCAGAYGMSMASTYNDHPKPAEVLVRGRVAQLIRPRQTAFELVASELTIGRAGPRVG